MKLKVQNGTEKLILNPNIYNFGRSAYICKSNDCINLAIKDKKIIKVLKVKNVEEVIPGLLSLASTPNPQHKGVMVK